MTTSASSSLKKELAALPIARIETMDQSYTLPLREYLFTNGCQVFVNSGPTENVTYFFVVGDSNFVKKTLAFRHNLGKKQLIVCWDPDDHESISQFLGNGSKIAFVDPIPLTSNVLADLLTFLFTTKGKELNIQTVKPSKKTRFMHSTEEEASDTINEIQTLVNDPIAPVTVNSYETGEKKRISKAIYEMFGGGKETHSSIPSGKQKKNVFTSLFGAFILTLIFFCSPFLLYIGSLLLRAESIKSATANFQNGKATAVSSNITSERFWSRYTQASSPFVHFILRFVLGDTSVQAYERIDKLLDYSSDIMSELLTMNTAILSLGTSLLLEDTDKTAISPVVAVDTIRKGMPSIKTKLDLAAAYLVTSTNPKVIPFSLPFVSTQTEKILSKLKKLRQVSEVGERISQLYPFIGGFKEKHHMVILLQNSSELRPTGGFIGSLAHLTISDGFLENIRIEDVYTLDGQLKGHITPPTPIKELLTQEHWYLRDSNWNPDFSQTARSVQFIYEKETGEQIESVVGLTSSFIVKILKVTGPVEIPIYNDRITADNFYLKSLYYTQNNFFPGSSQKKDFLGALMEALLSKLQNNPQSGIAIMEIIYDSLHARDIQWYTTNPEGQRAIEQFGWGGVVPVGTTCLTLENQPPCIFSYAHINEANMSVNKVNTFIQRSQTRSIQVNQDGTINETITRKIQNLSQGESGTGTYTTYIRIFFPTTSILTNLTLDGKPVAMKVEGMKKNVLPYGELDLSLPNLTGIGVALEVEPGRERIISASISYKESMLTEKKEVGMTVYDQKQAGVDTIPITTTIFYPPDWESFVVPSDQKDGVIANKGYLKYNTDLSEDSEFSFHLMR